ncbi:hypothetical protein HYZ98_01585 [Candidatus Peregrinibacteria bacterium]|nr:hypothetical protein [Candidatus Peregrinibacteria bacterium]
MPSKKLRQFFHRGCCILITLFFFWHAGAVAIYAIPSIVSDPVSVFLRSHASSIVRPYVLLTSQWQQWNLFAPDPLRRVTHYHFQRLDPVRDVWVDIAVFRPGAFLWWKHATRFKILDRVFDLDERDRKTPLQKHFLEKMCREFNLPSSTSVRMLHRYYVIPHIPELTSFSWWRTWQPAWSFMEGTSLSCP